MQLDWYNLVANYYILGLFCFVIFLLFSPHYQQEDLVTHGKTLQTLRPWHVSKRYFALFYGVGVFCCVALLRLDGVQEWLLLVHLMRRLGETITWPYSVHSSMHIVHAAVGITFYPVLVLTFLLTAPQFVTSMAAYLMIIFCSCYQHYIHRLLYTIRNEHHGYCPLSDMLVEFKYVICPHYLTEVVMYLCFAFLSGWSYLMLLNFAFITAILYISAESSLHWYNKTFPIVTNRPAAIFPDISKIVLSKGKVLFIH